MTVDIIFPVKLTGKKSCYFNEATGLFFAVDYTIVETIYITVKNNPSALLKQQLYFPVNLTGKIISTVIPV